MHNPESEEITGLTDEYSCEKVRASENASNDTILKLKQE